MSERLTPEQLALIRERHDASVDQIERAGCAPYRVTTFLKDVALLLSELDAVTKERDDARASVASLESEINDREAELGEAYE